VIVVNASFSLSKLHIFSDVICALLPAVMVLFLGIRVSSQVSHLLSRPLFLATVVVNCIVLDPIATLFVFAFLFVCALAVIAIKAEKLFGNSAAKPVVAT
jgi:hypothetical protein